MKIFTKNTYLSFFFFIILTKSFYAAADYKQDCIIGGRVFQEAMHSEIHAIAYGEQIEWRRIDYHLLPKEKQERLENDVIKMHPENKAIVARIMNKLPEWKQQGMDGNRLARDILRQGIKNSGEQYAIDCLKYTQESMR